MLHSVRNNKIKKLKLQTAVSLSTNKNYFIEFFSSLPMDFFIKFCCSMHASEDHNLFFVTRANKSWLLMNKELKRAVPATSVSICESRERSFSATSRRLIRIREFSTVSIRFNTVSRNLAVAVGTDFISVDVSELLSCKHNRRKMNWGLKKLRQQKYARKIN